MPQQIQAGVQVKTFADVQAQPNYQSLPSDVQAQIAMDFFKERVETQQSFQQAPPDAQESMRQDFLVKYNVPELKQPGRSAAPVQQKDLGMALKYSLSQTAPYLANVGKGLSLGHLDYTDQATGLANDVADQYGLPRASDQAAFDPSNQFAEIGGSFVPGLLIDKGASALGGQLTKLGAPIEAGIKWLASGGVRANAAKTGLSGLAEGLLYKKEKPEDWITQPLGYAASAAGIGGGLAALAKRAKLPPSATINFKGRSIKRPSRGLPKAAQGEYGLGTKMLRGTPQEIMANRAAAQSKYIGDVEKEYAALKAQGKNSEAAHFLSEASKVLPDGKKVAAQIRDRVNAASGKPAKKAKIAHTKEEKLERLAARVRELQRQGRANEADKLTNRYTPETKAKIHDRAREMGKAEKAARKAADDAAKYRAQEAKARVKNQQNLNKWLQEQRATAKKAADQAAKDRADAASTRVKHQQAIDKAIEDHKKAANNALKAQGKAAKKAADEAALQRAKEANERVKQRQAFNKERADRLAKEEKEYQERMAELDAAEKALKDAKAKQQVQNQKALEKAESAKRKRELDQLKASILSDEQEQLRLESWQQKMKGKKTNEPQGKTEQPKGAQPPKAQKETQAQQAKTAPQQTRAPQQGKVNKPVAVEAEQPVQAPSTSLKTAADVRARLDEFRNAAKARIAELKAQQAQAKGDKKLTDKLQREIDKLEPHTNVRLTAKGEKNLDELAAAFEQGKMVKPDYISDPKRPSNPIPGDTGERSIVDFHVSKTGNVSVKMHTGHELQSVRNYSLDSIDKVNVLDKPAKRFSDVGEVIQRVKAGDDVPKQDIINPAKRVSETEFKTETKDLESGKIEDICKKVTE